MHGQENIKLAVFFVKAKVTTRGSGLHLLCGKTKSCGFFKGIIQATF
jgi:hypothetical protein